MLLLQAFLSWLLLSPALAPPDDKSVDFDPQADFSQLHSFTVGPGLLQSTRPELRSDLVRKKIQQALRVELAGGGLHEAQQPASADLFVGFRLGSADKRELERWPTGPWGRGSRYTINTYSEGTLVVDLYRQPGRELVWRGIYRDDESRASKIAENLPKSVHKLLDKFPPRKKQPPAP